MDGRMLTRLGAVVFVGVAITAAAIEMTRKPDEEKVRVSAPELTMPTTPSRAMLRRCRDMGEGAAQEPACLEAWARNRDYFLGQVGDADASAVPKGPGVATTPAPSLAEPPDDPIRKESAPADQVEPAGVAVPSGSGGH